MKRTHLAAVSIAAASALALSACAPSATDTGDEVTLTLWSWRTEDVEKYNRIFDVYEEANPGVTIEFEAFLNTEYNQLLTTGLSGSDGPDIAMVRSYGGLQAWVSAGQLVPIDDIVDGLDAIEPAVLAGARGHEDGLIYGVPFATQTLQMFYNKGMFDELGLEEPTTWDEFIELNDALLAAGVTPMALGAKDSWMLPIFSDIIGAGRYGAGEFEAAVLSGEKNFTDPDYVASLALVDDMQQYLSPDVVGVGYTDAQIQFTSGLAAQYPGGTFELTTFNTQAPDLELGVYQVPLPPDAVADAPVTPAYADGSFAINSASEHQDEAAKLLNWFTTEEFAQLFADELSMFSPIPGVTYDDPVLEEMWDLYQASPASYLLLVNFRYGEPQGTAVLGEGVQQMFLGELDPAAVADKLQAGIDQWFVPGN
ncbi:extracellular solute-binding protein [Leifsonia sp. H3M29-4]|uniref:extracellular solute-binding protein n=1 Tax=Salinibacterium metalliresistens TaxID=3031321 RepID=UPI0023DBCCB6|nr:extracellular solute-binding protein [Salinibacterium metalliresistens]MDF1478281.1 extracellular solute-binding protein [Salinibacterium metalliresistens]